MELDEPLHKYVFRKIGFETQSPTSWAHLSDYVLLDDTLEGKRRRKERIRKKTAAKRQIVMDMESKVDEKKEAGNTSDAKDMSDVNDIPLPTSNGSLQ